MNGLLVWGAGAMGGTIGANLVRTGHRVTFVDRDRAHVEAMRTAGLEITGPVAAFTVAADALHPDELEGTWDRVLLCVKSHETEAAVDELAPFLADDGYVVSVQNGLCEPVIAARLGSSRTLGAFVNFGADRVGPGRIHWGGRGTVAVGEIDGRTRERLRDLLVVLQDFEPDAFRTGNIFGYLWSKQAYAALLFATALTDDPIADVLEDPEVRPVLVGLAREVCRVATAKGIRLEAFDGFDPAAFAPGADDAAATASLDGLVAFNRSSAKTHSGIWRDLAVHGRPTEVDAQLGPVVEGGAALQIPTPLVDAVVARIHEVESGARERGRRNLEDLRTLSARDPHPPEAPDR